MHIFFGATEAGEDECGLAGDEVGAVDFGGDLDGEFGFGECFGGVVGVGSGGEEVASEGDEDFDFALVECFDGHDGVVAVFFGRDEMEFLAEGGHEFVGHFFPDADGTVALDIGVAADRAEAGAGATDLAAEEDEVDDGLDIGDAVFMLGDAHAPAADHAFGMGGDVCGVVDVIARDTGLLDYFFPGFVAEVVGEGFEAFGIVGDEIVVEDFSAGEGVLFEHVFHDAFEEGDVAVDAELEEEGGDFCAGAEHGEWFLGIFEAEHAGFGEGVDGDDLAVVACGFLEFGEHARVTGAGVLTDDEDDIGECEVFDFDGAFSDADGGGEGRAGGFVAHVGAVGHVVGAELADEELVEEGGFVGRATGGVEGGFVGGREGVEFVADEGEGFVPVDGLVMVGTGAADHGVGDAALLAEPVVGLLGEFGEGMLGEEFGSGAGGGGFGGDGFGAVFAEFGGVAVVVGVGPRTGGAIEAIFLGDFEECLEGAFDAHVADAEVCGFVDGGEAGGHFVASAAFGVFFVARGFGAGDTDGAGGGGVGGFGGVVLVGGAVFVVFMGGHGCSSRRSDARSSVTALY